MRRTSKSLVVSIVLAAGLAGVFLSPLARDLLAAPRSKNPPAQVRVEESPINREQRAPISFAPVVQRVAPCVVNIYSTMVVREHPMSNPFFNDPFFRRFFGENGDQGQPRERKEQSLGSGVIVSPNGYILTANHVVEGAQSVKVALATGEKEFKARVVGTDPPTDVAVLKIDIDRKLPALPLGDSDKLEVGDTVLAVGNPFGVGQTVTGGIISALQRGGLDLSGYENFIQTDAAINPGNSGGALVDAEGRLVGINTAILSRSGGFMGVGFAVPINMARYVMDRLIEYGKVTRGYLGINIQPLSTDLAKELNVPEETGGVLVGGVTPNSPAAGAGLEDGDVVISLNGKKVKDPRALQLMVSETAPGTKVTLGVLRSEPGAKPVEKTLTATLGQLPQNAFASQESQAPEQNAQQSMDALAGVEVTDLDSAARQQFDIPGHVHGALVVTVEQDSPAAEAGLQPGDVIVEINRHPVRNANDAVSLSQNLEGEKVLLRVWSRTSGGPGGTHYLVVENSKNK